MTVLIDNQKIKKAIELVSSRSNGEKRVLSPDPKNEPYWHHLVRVHYWLVQNGKTDLPLLLSAILHDSVEDDYVEIEEIEKLFGSEVAEIVKLLSEKIHTDHNSNADRKDYFLEIDKYPNKSIRTKALKIKVSDRYDNLIGLSYTQLELKKEQYRREVDQFFKKFAKEVGMERYINEGIEILNGHRTPPNILLDLKFSI